MFPGFINPSSLLDGAFFKQLQGRFSEFPKAFGQLFRSLVGRSELDPEAPGFPSPSNRFPKPIYMGAITPDNPTIYSLLRDHPQYGGNSSTIINATSNNDKAFDRIPTGSYVYLHPHTREITWSMKPPPDEVLRASGSHGRATDPLSNNLAHAVQSYMGRSYDEIDCYELVVNGLTDMGFQYHGMGGIKDRLVEMAQRTGKKSNAYLTGEGLIQAAGHTLYSRFVPPSRKPAVEAERIFNEMGPRLNKGYILSFSTQTRGHTGIISRHGGQWTFVNSGNMDNNLVGSQQAREVGEENLKAEIENWIRRASRRNERLQISMGRLDGKKLASFFTPGGIIEKRA